VVCLEQGKTRGVTMSISKDVEVEPRRGASSRINLCVVDICAKREKREKANSKEKMHICLAGDSLGNSTLSLCKQRISGSSRPEFLLTDIGWLAKMSRTRFACKCSSMRIIILILLTRQ